MSNFTPKNRNKKQKKGNNLYRSMGLLTLTSALTLGLPQTAQAAQDSWIDYSGRYSTTMRPLTGGNFYIEMTNINFQPVISVNYKVDDVNSMTCRKAVVEFNGQAVNMSNCVEGIQFASQFFVADSQAGKDFIINQFKSSPSVVITGKAQTAKFSAVGFSKAHSIYGKSVAKPEGNGKTAL